MKKSSGEKSQRNGNQEENGEKGERRRRDEISMAKKA